MSFVKHADLLFLSDSLQLNKGYVIQIITNVATNQRHMHMMRSIFLLVRILSH